MKLKMIAAYVGAALACWTGPIPKELLYGPQLKGQMIVPTSTPQVFAGRTALASGTASVTVSTALVNSDSIIEGTWIPAATVASGTYLAPIVPMSIVHGVSFAIAQADGTGRGPGGTYCWEIKRTS